MITRESTSVGISPFNFFTRKQIRPTNSRQHFSPKRTTVNPLPVAFFDNKLYRFMTFLLVLLGGCNQIKSEKEEEKTLQQRAQILEVRPDTVFKPLTTKDIDVEGKLAQLQKDFFKRNLLVTIDEIDALSGHYYKVGKGLVPQMLLNKRLTPEVFPVLWNKVFVDGPNKAIIAEFTEPGEFAPGSDFGRGLRLVLRKKVGELNISTILFLDYNEKTKRLEFPHDFFFKDKKNLIPDAMRTLIEYDVKPSKEELKRHTKIYSNDFVQAEFFGTTISAEIDDKSSSVVDFHIHPTRDAYDNAPLGIDGKALGVTSLLSCIGCHESKREGFIGTDTSFEEMQRTLHLPAHQDTAIKDFLKYVRKNKHFDSTKDRTKILDDLEKKLRNPKENLSDLLPTGFLEALERKQSTFTHQSSVLDRYHAISSKK